LRLAPAGPVSTSISTVEADGTRADDQRGRLAGPANNRTEGLMRRLARWLWAHVDMIGLVLLVVLILVAIGLLSGGGSSGTGGTP
jgi:hypothetical protein